MSTYGSNLCALHVGLSLNVDGDRKLTFRWENVTVRLIEEVGVPNAANRSKCGTISRGKCKRFYTETLQSRGLSIRIFPDML